MRRQRTISDPKPDDDLIVGLASDVAPVDEAEPTGEEAAESVIKDNAERVAILDGLAKAITDKWTARLSARASKEAEWRMAESLYSAPLGSMGEDLPETPWDKTKANGRRPYPNIVRIKCDTAISNSVEMQFGGGVEKNWDLMPPANNTDPRIGEACRLMEKEIESQLSATKYSMKARRAMTDRVIFGTGVVKGPVNTGKRRIQYVQDAAGEWIPRISDEKTPALEHVSPWRVYPDMTVNDFSDAQDVIEVHPMRPLELSGYAEHPGFDGDVIRQIIKGDANNDPIVASTYNTENYKIIKEASWAANPYMYKDRYVVLEYHGPVTYDDLQKLGIEPTYQSPTMEYYGEVWVCCGKVIRMELENIEGHYETPYAFSIWKKDPTSPFGYGHPLLLADAQQVIAQTYHMILDNAALTSGTQVAMYAKYIQPIDNDWTIRPNKVWLLTDPAAKIDDAIKFFTPQNTIGNIMPVLELTRQFADEQSATSGVASGMPSAELTDTASGQLMMRQASTALLDYLSEDWDDDVTEKIIRRWYAWNMQYNPKNEIKGDYIIDVKSASEFKNKAMYVRDLERLSMEVSQNPQMQDVINVDELYAARLSVMKLPAAGIVRTPEEIAAARQQRAQQPNPQMLDMQVKMIEAQVAQAKVQLQQAELKFNATKEQQRQAWEHEERMAAVQARMAEAQSRVLAARSEAQVEMLKLAQKNQQFSLKMQKDKELAQLATDSRIFVESMREQTKQRKNDITEQELSLAKETGQGI
jgi:hypothetical protein